MTAGSSWPRAERRRPEYVVTPAEERRRGALPVVGESLRRLGVAAIGDGLCPSAARAYVTHGQVVEALVANRLASPMPMPMPMPMVLFRAVGRSRARAVEEAFGTEPALLNDVHPDHADERLPAITYGHPKGRRTELKQVRAGLVVTGDGGIPVHAGVFDGGAAEIP